MGRAFEVRKAAMAKTSAAKTKVYSKFGKEIYIAAKSGEPNPDMNQSLRRIIDKAKSAQVPADIIKRAIDKAKGNDDTQYNEVRYEGFGSGAATIIVECLTDNVNRTYADVRNAFNKSHGKLGVMGSVIHTFDHVGLLQVPYNDEEAALETLIEAEVDVIDLEIVNDELSVSVAPSDLYKAKEALSALIDQDFSVFETTYIAQENITLEGDDLTHFNKLLGMLEALDDVSDVYHNVNL